MDVSVVVVFICIVCECTVMNISYTVVCSNQKYVDSNFLEHLKSHFEFCEVREPAF